MILDNEKQLKQIKIQMDDLKDTIEAIENTLSLFKIALPN